MPAHAAPAERSRAAASSCRPSAATEPARTWRARPPSGRKPAASQKAIERAIADHPGNGAAGPGNLAPDEVLEGPDPGPHVLGIGAVGCAREPDEVAEHDREQAALVAGRGLLGRRQDRR